MRFPRLACALLAALPGSAALADGVCEKPHDTSPAELAAMTASLEAMVRALPAAPEGWTIDSDDPSIPEQICLDGGAKAWAYSHTRHFTRVANLEARDEALVSANRALQANLAEKQPRIEALQAQQAELIAKVTEAAQKNDLARLEALGREGDAINAQLAAIINGDGAIERADAAAATASRDLEMTATITVNALRQGNGGWDTVAAPGGGAAAVRLTDGYGAEEVVLVGDWQLHDGEAYDLAPRTGAPPHAPHGVAISLRADVDRLDAFVGAVDFNAVASTLAR